MLPFKKILCPTDFSEPSYEAIKAAGKLAHHFSAELCVVHVVSPIPVVPMGHDPSAFNVVLYEQELETSSKRSLEEIIHQMEWRDLKVRLIVLRGNAADEIVRVAEEEMAELIVIATRGRTGLDRLIFGSVAEKVVRLAPCPVLTVSSRPSTEDRKETTEEKGEKMEVPEEKSEKRKAYQEKIEGQLKEWAAKIDELKVKAGTSKAELKIKYEEQIKDLRAKQDVLEKKLQGLKESGGEAWDELKTGVEKSLDELKESFDQTITKFKGKAEEMAEAVSEKKKAYVEKIEDQLKDWGSQIDILKAKAEKSKAEVKIKYLEQIQELKSKQETVKQKLHELRESGDEAWGDFKEGVEDALGEMKKALKRAVSRFKKS